MFKPGEKRPVKYCHPQEWTLCWTGYGQKPKWLIVALEQGVTLEQCAAAAEEVRARAADIRKSEEEVKIAVTITKNPGLVQEQLPGLPPVPKKRGRPSTGKAKSAAQRKRDSRERARDLHVENYKALSDSQLCEAIARQVSAIGKRDPEYLDSQKWHYDRLIAELNSRVAAL